MNFTNEDENKSKKKLYMTVVILIIVFIIAAYKLGKIIHFDGSDSIYYVYNNILSDVFNNKIFTNVNLDEFGIGMINVYQKDINVIKNTPIDIFNNEKYDGRKIIAPRSKGSAKFGVKNVSNGDIIYDVGFTDQSNYLVNMKYKLKIDNIYIVGDKDHYVTLDQMKVNDITVINGSNNVFTIEWYWEDDDPRDVIVGMAEPTQYYTLNLAITAREYHDQ